MAIHLELALADDTVPTWLVGVTTIRYLEHDRFNAAYYPPDDNGIPDPTTLIIDPRRFISLRLLTAEELEAPSAHRPY